MTADEQYSALIKDVLVNGTERDDRTNTGTLSVFGARMQFDLQAGFPLLTSKRVFFRGVAEELLWMIKGCTDAKVLSDKGVKIWDANGSAEFLKKHNLAYEEGELGPVYGHQWRHFNAKYEGAHADYTDKGCDQLLDVIRLIKNNPTSRRIILSAWNPAQNDLMVLPACHTLCQFYVNPNEKALSCQLYQRSGDIGLGIPFNIASYALLTHLIAKTTDLIPKTLIHVIGDAHIYKTHIDSLTDQLASNTFESPSLCIINKRECIEDYTMDDILLENYTYSTGQSMLMAV
jgi:thymidylate synthase